MSVTPLLHIQRYAPDRAVSYKLCPLRADGKLSTHPQRHCIPLDTAPPNYTPGGRYSVFYYDALDNVLAPKAPCTVDLEPSRPQPGVQPASQRGRQPVDNVTGRKPQPVSSANEAELAQATQDADDG